MEENSAKDRAASLARDMAAWYMVQMGGVSTGLTGIMAALVRYQPVYADVSRLFSAVGPVLLDQASSNTIKLVQISPNGWVRDTFPKSLEPTDLDLFALDSDREAALKTVRSRQLTLQGPTPFVQGGYGVIVRRPIFVKGIPNTSALGMPAPLNPICGAACAFDPATNSTFWGFSAVLIDLPALNAAPDSRPRMLDGLGYRYEVRALGLAADDMRLVAASSTLPGADAMEAKVILPNNEWLVRVAPADGWTSTYYGGLIAAVVVLAFVVSALLFAALVLWRRHQMLLGSLLPRKVIQDLYKAGGAALEETCGRVVLNTDTTADVMLRVLTDVVCGEAPAISDVMLVRSAIARSADIYEPIIGITEQMQEAHMDRDVAENLAQQLTCTSMATAVVPRNITWQRAAGPGGRLLPKCVAAVPSSAASADTSFRGSGLALSFVEAGAAGGLGESPRAGGGGAVAHGSGKAAGGVIGAGAGGYRRAGSSEALHLADVFVALPYAVGRDDSSLLLHTVTGLPSAPLAAASASHVAIAVSPRAPGAGAAAVAAALPATPTAAAPDAVMTTAGAGHAFLAVAAVAPAELALPTVGALTTTATTSLIESAALDGVTERGGPSAAAAAAAASAAAASSSGAGGRSACDAQHPLQQVAAGRVSSEANGNIAAPGLAAASTAGGGPSAADMQPDAADKLRPLPELLTRGTSHRRQRTSQRIADDDHEAQMVATDSEDGGDGLELAEAAAAAVVARGSGSGASGMLYKQRASPSGHVHSGAHSGASAHHYQQQAGRGGSARRMLRPQHSAVRVSTSARLRGLLYSPGGPPPQHQQQHEQPPGSAGSSSHLVTRPTRHSDSGALVSGGFAATVPAGEAAVDSGAAAGAAAQGEEATSAGADGARSPFLTGSAAAPGLPSLKQRVMMAPPRAMLEEVERVLAAADAWQFDTFRLAEVSGGLPLSALGYFLIQRAGLIRTLRLSSRTLIRCLRVIEAGYVDNPYHSATHAADVLQTLHVIIHSGQLHVHYLDPLGLLAAYWAAIVHDYRHPGLTSDFLIATGHPLAIRYNDKAPLENHHAAASFAVLRRRGLELLQPLPAEARVAFRKQVIEMVLATDMKQHFALCSQFSTVHRLSAFSAERAKAAAPLADATGGATPRAKTFGRVGSLRATELQEVVMVGPEPLVTVSGSKGIAAAGAQTPMPVDESERLLALCVAIKAADLGHLGESLEVHKRWLAGLEEEFFRQGDQERELGMPISPLFDRSKQGVSKSQVGFYEFVGLPLVHALSSAFPGAAPLMACFTSNYHHWLRVQQEAQAQQEAAQGQ
ncbi:hypothetical protein HYH02_007881 [Chlamydomonas schloesseri]|uniref:Phosphodiesterase n=1 Tax=Chlamydomonas schloesseri TaxID=2026947 RepID=A0A835WHL1_9CHLO|nr:hypothetical protein HYH02_007881 [Chlamydomonas schloesseri]|eukprot:KAG2447135.1 hypothetical protein HYH02_007881 [Chlamydomonas schloesseri]